MLQNAPKYSLILLLSFITTPLYTQTGVDEEINGVTVESNEQQNLPRYIDFVFTDLLGNRKSVLRPTPYFEDDVKDGLFFDGSSVPGYSSISMSDMLLKPDPSTLHRVPWTEGYHNTARVTCDVYKDTENPYMGDPRVRLKESMHKAHNMGFEFFIGLELEFFLFEKEASSKLSPIDTGCYFNHAQTMSQENGRAVFLDTLINAGIIPEKMHHEVAPGQYEIVLRYNNALAMADALTEAKNIISVIADANQMVASFMPKPLFGENGSGMHMHFSLWDTVNDTNAFYDSNDALKLSATGRSFIAGVLNRLPEITALFNPSVNSYKRLVPGYEAPIFVACGMKNRSAAIRLPENCGHAHQMRAELRSPDPSANPYLAFAILLEAGLAGVENNEKLPPLATDNLYHLAAQEIADRGIRSLPTSLKEAVNLFEQSSFARNVLGDCLVDNFVQLKKDEVRSFDVAVSDWEYDHCL